MVLQGHEFDILTGAPLPERAISDGMSVREDPCGKHLVIDLHQRRRPVAYRVGEGHPVGNTSRSVRSESLMVVNIWTVQRLRMATRSAPAGAAVGGRLGRH